MSSTTDASAGRAQIAERTLRTDRWWLPPLANFVGLAAWVIYATVRAFLQRDYFVPEYNYLTPFYSPCVSYGCVPEASHFGQFVPDSPLLPYALVSLPFLLLFRLTCYYYRKAYYRAFWLSPPACAVAEPHRKYTGETRFPLIFQNVHRYFFYAAVLISLINTYDAVRSFITRRTAASGSASATSSWWPTWCCCGRTRCPATPAGSIIGGRLKHFSKHPLRYKFWGQVSKLNKQAHATRLDRHWHRWPSPTSTSWPSRPDWFSDLRIVG